MKKFFKNIEMGKVLELESLEDYRKERVISPSILDNGEISRTVFDMDVQEKLKCC